MSKNHSALEGHFKSSQQMLTSILFTDILSHEMDFMEKERLLVV